LVYDNRCGSILTVAIHHDSPYGPYQEENQVDCGTQPLSLAPRVAQTPPSRQPLSSQACKGVGASGRTGFPTYTSSTSLGSSCRADCKRTPRANTASIKLVSTPSFPNTKTRHVSDTGELKDCIVYTVHSPSGMSLLTCPRWALGRLEGASRGPRHPLV
jgi:hypothetical protein